MVVKNYTGDIMNFRMAGQYANANFNMTVKYLTVNDDIALNETNKSRNQEGRGIAGTVLVYKILGVLSYEMSLTELLETGEQIISRLASVGMTMNQAGLLELGKGIHGEKGCQEYEPEDLELMV